MSDTLSICKAKELIEFIFNTNYKLAPFGDGCFDSKEKAIAFVENENYRPDEPLNVVFETTKGEQTDSLQVSFDNNIWSVEDMDMGGKSASGSDIMSALTNFRSEADPTGDYYPVELTVNT